MSDEDAQYSDLEIALITVAALITVSVIGFSVYAVIGTDNYNVRYSWDSQAHELTVNSIDDGNQIVVDNGTTEVRYDSIGLKKLDEDSGVNGNIIADGTGSYTLYVVQGGNKLSNTTLSD